MANANLLGLLPSFMVSSLREHVLADPPGSDANLETVLCWMLDNHHAIEDLFGLFGANDVRSLPRPTHTDMGKLVEDAIAFAREYPDCRILPADEPAALRIGYVLFSVRDGEEIMKNLSISIMAVKDYPDRRLATSRGRLDLAEFIRKSALEASP